MKIADWAKRSALVFALLALSVVVHAQTPGSSDTASGTWISPPADGVQVDFFVGAFWNIVDWFTPFLLKLLGIAAGTYALTVVAKHLFKGDPG